MEQYTVLVLLLKVSFFCFPASSQVVISKDLEATGEDEAAYR